jgi:Schlafen, AlbA_2
MFGKLPSELTPEDIDRVRSEQVQEGSQVEFKETLPAKGAAVDPWVSGKDQVGDFARNKLVEEVIAFANAYGGWLLVGIQETSEKPARASAVAPIRDCAELAERLRLMCRDCIEPKLPVLEVAGVSVADDEAGVVVFHVPRSRMAPHRHTVTKECYVRRADRTEKMTMREIQDLTLQVERGLAAIERQFQERREQFARRFAAFRGMNTNAFGLRATLVPLTPIYVDRVHQNAATSPPAHKLWATSQDGRSFDLDFRDRGAAWRPLIRGSLNFDSSRGLTNSREVHCDGLIEYIVMHQGETEKSGPREPEFHLPIHLVMGLFGNALCAAERFRRAAGAPDVEYGLEFEPASPVDLPVGPYGGIFYMGTFGPLPAGTTFPRYSVGTPDEFQSLSQAFQRDFWNGAGCDPPDLPAIDFERALGELGVVDTTPA